MLANMPTKVKRKWRCQFRQATVLSVSGVTGFYRKDDFIALSTHRAFARRMLSGLAFHDERITLN
jgi:hypothetical protein